MKYSMASDKGMVRQTNQDSCYVSMFEKNSCFAIVCDGMGGSNAGDVASDIAVKMISERFTAGCRKDITASSIKNLLITAIGAANVCIYDAQKSNIKLKGMGTTVVAAVIVEDSLIIAHVGDSRAYIAGKEIKLVTKDHSLVQELIDSGALTEKQALFYPNKNIITRALGIEEHVDIDFTETRIDLGERILLCSDGLTNYVPEKEIFDIVNENEVTLVSDKLIAAANHNGGGDNITVVVIEK